MATIRYIPFLKLKTNEVGALAQLSSELKSQVIPFFDIPRKQNMSELQLIAAIEKGAKKLKKHLKDFDSFYVDSYDIDDDLLVDGMHNYVRLISEFSELPFIPVIGLDRQTIRNKLVFEKKVIGRISSNRVAIRLQPDDFLSFNAVRLELQDLVSEAKLYFQAIDVVLDNRLCLGTDVPKRASEIVAFINKLDIDHKISRIIVAGSSIPASIGDIVPTEEELHHEREELKILANMKGKTSRTIIPGDYTVISPLYSDVNIPPAALRNVMTAKVIYSHAFQHYISRGGALRSHVRGELQYNDIAKEIISQPFYRGAPYSFGDQFLAEKAVFVGKSVTASSILKPTINLHMTYMLKDCSLVP